MGLVEMKGEEGDNIKEQGIVLKTLMSSACEARHCGIAAAGISIRRHTPTRRCIHL